MFLLSMDDRTVRPYLKWRKWKGFKNKDQEIKILMKDAPASTSWMMLDVCGAGDETQHYVRATQAFYELSHSRSLDFVLAFRWLESSSGNGLTESMHQLAAQDDCGRNSRTCSLHTPDQKSDAAGPFLPPGDAKNKDSHSISKGNRWASEFCEGCSAGIITLMRYLSSRSAVAVKKPVPLPREQHHSLTNNSCSKNILSVHVLAAQYYPT